MTTESKVHRELRPCMEEGSFDKEELEIRILNWMPFQVSNHTQCNCALFINPTLILLA